MPASTLVVPQMPCVDPGRSVHGKPAQQSASVVHAPPAGTQLEPQISGLAQETNAALLGELLPGVPVLPFPWLAAPRDLGALAAAAARCGIDSLFDRAGAVSPGGS